MLTHIAFDFDGTLADSLPLVLDLYNDLAAQRGYARITADNFGALRALSVRERCRAVGLPLHHLPGFITQLATRYRHVTDALALHEGVPEVLRDLHARNVRVCVVSTNHAENIRDVLRRHDLLGIVGDVHTSNRMFGKAHLLRALVRRERISPAQLLYVGDEVRDVQASHAAGVAVAAVTWGADLPSALRAAQPTFLVDRPAALLAQLEGRVPGT
ncbi:HAD hydrolase-like protein [Deinococcus maricopensis]|nr:HAD hydrolase-like protein [Deinococcus maricopensis]